MSSITLHNLEPELDRRLRDCADERHSSLNRTIQSILKEALGLETGGKRKSDFTRYAGAWTDDDLQEFEKVTGEFSAIDEELWK